MRNICVVAAAFFACLSNSAVFAQKQVTYQINTAHDGATEFPGGFNTPLQRVWSRVLPAEIAYPIIADGRVFFTQRRSGNAALMALDLATGRRLWTASIPTTSTWSAAAYDNGKLFVIEIDGYLRAIDAATGQRLWSKLIPQRPYTATAIPTAKYGMVYVTTDGPLDAILHAVDQDDGAVVWRQTLPLSGAGSPPTVSEDRLFLSYACQTYSFDAHTGRRQWRFNGICYGGEGHAAVLYSDRVYSRAVRTLVSPRTTFAFDANSGERLVVFRDIVETPAFYDGVGYFPGRDQFVARSTSTNEVMWRFTDAQPLAKPPLVINGKVILASVAGTLFVLDGKTGAELQRISLGVPLTVVGDLESPQGLGAGEGMLIVSDGRKVFAFKGAP